MTSNKDSHSTGTQPRRRPWLLFAAALLALCIPWIADGGAGVARAATTHPPVVVSLTFDDGAQDQMQAASLLSTYGLRGTFYLNSGRLGATGYISTAQALALQDAGNEIGGHTVSHADLPTLSTDEAKRQVCNDRVNLLNAGFQVANFAYPFGDSSTAVKQIVHDCGYNSARGVGDIVSPGTCMGCDYAEQIPPEELYDLATPDSVKAPTTLEDMQTYVLQAEQHGGGWVNLVMHHVCNGCDPYSVSPSQLDAFLGWLAARADDGTTVKTVAEVIGGTVKPGVPGPVAPPPLSTTNLLRNPSMETINANTGVPSCWQRGGYGTNSYSWSNTTDAKDGGNAQKVTITSYTDGDRKMISPQDLGDCAPATVPGHTYQVRGWYKTNGTARLIAYYRNSAGGWVFLSQGPILAASSTYTQTMWTTPTMPAGSTALSVGFSLRSVGSLTGDDLKLNDSDQTAPTASITSPPDGSRVRDTITFSATASDASGVDHVDFLVDGSTVCTATTAPYSCTYDTTSQPDSVIAVTARAVDKAGHIGLSAGRNYTVSNSIDPDTTRPSVNITSPVEGSTVNGTVTLSASASDDDALSEVIFYVNGTEVGARNADPYDVDWDTTAFPEGSTTVTAAAIDISGNVTKSDPVTVTVNNNALDTIPPTSSISCNGGACATSWYSNAESVSLSAIDAGSGIDRIVYTTDGTDPSTTNGLSYTAPFSLSASTTVKYRAYDVAGNAEAIKTTVLNIDTVPPTASITSPKNGATVTGITYIVAGVSDNISIARVYFYLDGKLLGSRIVTPYQWKWDTSGVAKGTHNLTITAVDQAGNQTKSSAITVTVA